jgi:glutamate racemase
VTNSPTILVFDSGLGGLTVLREVVAARSDAHYVYVADDAFFPYGHHSEDEIIARVVPLMGELVGTHDPDLVVIACNTASTLVLSHLRAAYSLPFVGTVPAIKPACAKSRSRRVSVVGSPELAALAEAELSGSPVTDDAILAELAPCFVGDAGNAGARTDTVVLACTHYPLLLDRLKKLAPWPVDWIDPAPAIARRVSDLLGPHTGGIAQSGAEMIFTSNRVHGLSAMLMPFFGGRIPA